MELKYIVFFVVVLVGVPIGVFLTRASSRFMHLTFVSMIVSLCESDMLEVMFVSRPFYRTITRGLGFSVAEICALVLLFGMLLRRDEYRIRWLPPMLLVHAFYIFVIVISWLMVDGDVLVPGKYYQLGLWAPLTTDYFEISIYPLFELSKVFRGLLIFWVVVSYLSREENFKFLLLSVILLATYVGSVALFQRYVQGIHRVSSTLSHPNIVATYMVMCFSILFGYALKEKDLKVKTICFTASALCLVTIIMTLSRGGMATVVIVCGLQLLLLYKRNLSISNNIFAFFGILCALIVFAKSMDTLMSRFEAKAHEDYEYRADHNKQAKVMGDDNLFGVGMGNFSAMSWVKYHAQVNSGKGDFPGTPAHNLWYLTFAELGWPGLLAFALIWLRYFYIVVKGLFIQTDNSSYTWLVICSVAMIGMHLQEMLNNGYRFTPINFTMQIIVGATIAIYLNNKQALQEVEKTDFDVT
ncbi:MAG: O-antigen ligase family protein [Lentisphaeraceae bacterium]|nr:O-antigen ligase family protein [Lentisphaeraceae bacterium]